MLGNVVLADGLAAPHKVEPGGLQNNISAKKPDDIVSHAPLSVGRSRPIRSRTGT